jgi:hypothetical protein
MSARNAVATVGRNRYYYRRLNFATCQLQDVDKNYAYTGLGRRLGMRITQADGPRR